MIRYRDLPGYCFEPLRVPELEEGATNEELARAYREARAQAALLEQRVVRCRELAAGDP